MWRDTQLLAYAIGAVKHAVAQMKALNQLCNIDVSTYTLLTQELQANNGRQTLGVHLAGSTPGEEVTIFTQVPDGKGCPPLLSGTWVGSC